MTRPLSASPLVLLESPSPASARGVSAAVEQVESIYDVPEAAPEKSFPLRSTRSSSITEYFHAAAGAFTEGHYTEF